MRGECGKAFIKYACLFLCEHVLLYLVFVLVKNSQSCCEIKLKHVVVAVFLSGLFLC